MQEQATVRVNKASETKVSYNVYWPKVWLFKGQFSGQYTSDSIQQVFNAWLI